MNKYIAESIGTFMLVFAGCGAIIVNDVSGGPLGHAGISLTFGLVVMAVIYAIGNVSGAHLNPAVTFGFWAAKRLPFRQVPPYVLAQCIGALVASLLHRFIFSAHANFGATVPAGPWEQAFVLEIFLTFMLMFVILNVSTGAMEKGIMAGAAIGGTVLFCAMFGGPISGASMNPARSLAPAIVSGTLTHLWIYIVAPLIGAACAYPACRLSQGADCCSGSACAPQPAD